MPKTFNILGRFFWICVALGWISACASAPPEPKKNRLAGEIPRYDGVVKPIREPLFPRYAPCKGKFVHSLTKYAKYPDQNTIKEMVQDLEITGSYDVQSMGEFLVRQVHFEALVVDKQTYAPGMPLLQTRAIIDRRGHVKKIEFSAPALRRSNIDIEDMEKYMEESIRSMTVLPEGPIRNGDVITKFKGGVLPDILMDASRGGNTQRDLEYRLQGWSYFNQRKVVVAAAHEAFTAEIGPSKSILFDVRLDGYNLYDFETFQLISGERLITVTNNPRYKNPFVYRVFVRQSSEIETD